MRRNGFLLFLLFTIACFGAKPKQAEYWKEYYKIQNSIRKVAIEKEKWKIASGSLQPNQEEKLIKKENKYTLFFEAKHQGEQVVSTEKPVPENFESQPYSFLYTEYQPSYFQKQETYLFKRILSYKLRNAFHPQDFLAWIGEMQTLPNPKKNLESNPLFIFLCKNFQCDIENEPKSWVLSLKPQKALQKLDPNFYNRVQKLLDTTDFSLHFSSSNYSAFQILSESKNLKIIWNRENPISEKLQSAELQINLKVNFYGLNIEIQNWNYGFQFQKKGHTSSLTGKFLNIPKYKISGRLGYILPQGILNLFIPKNMDAYFAQFFKLRKDGNFGKGHTWSVQLKPSGKEYEMLSVTESEIPRKVFSFLGGNEKPEKEIFIEIFQDKLIESLL